MNKSAELSRFYRIPPSPSQFNVFRFRFSNQEFVQKLTFRNRASLSGRAGAWGWTVQRMEGMHGNLTLPLTHELCGLRGAHSSHPGLQVHIHRESSQTAKVHFQLWNVLPLIICSGFLVSWENGRSLCLSSPLTSTSLALIPLFLFLPLHWHFPFHLGRSWGHGLQWLSCR